MITTARQGELSWQANGLETLVVESFHVESFWGAQDGRWYRGSSPFFDVTRSIRAYGRAVVVSDLLANRTDEDCPVRARYLVPREETSRCGGMPQDWSMPSNPTCWTGDETGGAGLLAYSDAFRIHHRAMIEEEDEEVGAPSPACVSLNDGELVLPAGESHLVTWAIIPARDYWDFMDVCRGLLGGCCTIPRLPAYLRIHPTTIRWSEEQIIQHARLTGGYGFVSGPPLYQGLDAHGTAFARVDLSTWGPEIARRQRLLPDFVQYGYFHCFLDVSEDAHERFPESRVLKVDGSQGVYANNPRRRLFVPTLGSAWGEAIRKNLRILRDFGMRGIYWDEMRCSAARYTYGPMVDDGTLWDRCSGDIGPDGRLLRRASSITLLSLPWRLETARNLLAEGVPILCNQPPWTNDEALLRVPSFTEVPSGQSQRLGFAHPWMPVGLAKDGVTSQKEALRRDRELVDNGGLPIHWRDLHYVHEDEVMASACYPLTPLVVRPGLVAGPERAILSQPGVVSWGDDSQHRITLFNSDGYRVAPQGVATTMVVAGVRHTEVRLPLGWVAVVAPVTG